MMSPRQRVVLAVLAGAGAAWFIAAHPPTAGSPYPPCLIHALTGWHCPGCGSARALHAAAHARFAAAFDCNPLAMIALGGLIPWGAWQAWLGLRHNRFATLTLPPAASWSIVAAIALFTVARNLPWAPFASLAPP